MAEIGAQLREARTRARIEIAQMEAQTKIRAKYLRALENEEWELLPGPTYVKSFLRTYGDMLGIDGRQLVAEYKGAHEPFQGEGGDIGQLSKHSGGRMNRQQQASAGTGRLIALGVLLIALVGGGGYYLLGRDDSASTGAADTQTPAAGTTEGDDADATPAAAERKTLNVSVAATADNTTVCVRAARRIAVPEIELRSGQKTATVRGKSVVVTATTRNIRITVDGKRAALPAGTGAITVSITDAGVKKAGSSATACRV